MLAQSHDAKRSVDKPRAPSGPRDDGVDRLPRANTIKSLINKHLFMTERLGERLDAEEDKPRFNRYELAGQLAELVAVNGGEYGETLKVDPAGRVMHRSRHGDNSPAYLPAFLETRQRHDPSIEDMYQALRDIGDALPGYEISINEDRTAGVLEYRIRRRKRDE